MDIFFTLLLYYIIIYKLFIILSFKKLTFQQMTTTQQKYHITNLLYTRTCTWYVHVHVYMQVIIIHPAVCFYGVHS